MARGFGATNGSSSSDSIELPYNTHSDLCTFACWIYKLSNGGGNLGRIFAKDTSVGGNERLNTASSNELFFAHVWSGGTGEWRTTTAPVSLSTWTHVAVTYDGSSASNDAIFYINGALVASTENTAPSGTITTDSDNYVIGNRKTSTARNWDGNIAEFAKWNRVLSADEIAAVYKASPMAIMNGLVIYAPLIRDTMDLKNGTSTVVGTAVQNHPRVVYETSTMPTSYTPVVVPPAPAAPVATFRVYIDLDDDGDFLDTGEEITDDVKNIKWRVGFRGPFQEMADENTAVITLNNTDGKYNPENVSSPLYGLLVPGKRIQITFDDDTTETVMYTGWVEWPEPEWRPAGDYTAKTEAVINGVGAKFYLDNLEVPSDLYNNATGDEIIEDLLTATGLETVSTDFSQINTGLTVFASYGDNLSDISVYRQIEDISKVERGRFFFDRESRGAWWNRHHLFTISPPIATVSDSSGDYKPTGLNYKYGRWLANKVRVEAAPRRSDGSETLWELDQEITIYAGQIQEFEAKLRRSTGQFAASSAIVASPTFSSGTCAVSVTEKGNLAILTLDNSANTDNAILTGLSLTGGIIRDQNQMTIEVSDATSIAAYGPRGYSFDMGPSTDHVSILGAAQYELMRRKDPQGDVAWIKYLREADGVDNLHLIEWQIGDLITVSLLNGHSASYWIIGEEHATKMDGTHETTYYLEFGAPGVFWLVGVTGFSELGQTTVLGY